MLRLIERIDKDGATSIQMPGKTFSLYSENPITLICLNLDGLFYI